MTTPLPVARALFVFMSLVFVLCLVEGNLFLLFYAVMGLLLAGYLVGAAVASERSSSRR